MLNKYLLIVFLSILFSFNSIASDYKIDTLIINSKVLTENRTIIIYIPTEINTTDPVSIIYLLDGEYSKSRYEKIFEQSDKHIIGIGIVNTDKRRDMLPVKEAGNFLKFISEELIPIVETNYKTKQRILFGHSFAGAFTLYTMLNRPGLFNKYIASSPTPIMDFIEPLNYSVLDLTLDNKIKFYFSYGTKDMKQVKKWSEKLNNSLITLDLRNINWKNEIYLNEDHNTCDTISLLKGLKY
jgi:hypothetical protein